VRVYVRTSWTRSNSCDTKTELFTVKLFIMKTENTINTGYQWMDCIRYCTGAFHKTWLRGATTVMHQTLTNYRDVLLRSLYSITRCVSCDSMNDSGWRVLLCCSICQMLTTGSAGRPTAYRPTTCVQRMPSCWTDSIAIRWSLIHRDKPRSSSWMSTGTRKLPKQGEEFC